MGGSGPVEEGFPAVLLAKKLQREKRMGGKNLKRTQGEKDGWGREQAPPREGDLRPGPQWQMGPPLASAFERQRGTLWKSRGSALLRKGESRPGSNGQGRK